MKQQPNHRLYVTILRRMGAENRLKKAFELSEFSRALLRRGLEITHPELSEPERERLYRERVHKASNRIE
jgi:hypothetical protein